MEVPCSVFQKMERQRRGGMEEQGHIAVHMESFSLNFSAMELDGVEGR